MVNHINWWNGKKIVLLGGASLIGSHLAQALMKLPVASVRVVDDLSSGRLENLQYLGIDTVQDVEFHARDLRNYDNALRMVMRSDIVFHLAAQHGGRGYVAGHKTELYNNLELDTTIFRACMMAGVEKVVFSSSACAYPIKLQQNTEDALYLNEDLVDYNDIQQPDGPYGEEKLMGEKMLDAHVEQGDFKGVSTRSFTVYGPLMKENHAIAALISKFMIRQDPLEIWGDGNQIRNWTYVEDNVAGALLAAQHIDRGAINIGVEESRTPLGAHSHIGHIMGWYPRRVQLLPDKPVGPVNRVADATKLKSLGWKPKYTFEEGLRKTIEWYLNTHTIEEVRVDFERKLTER